MTRNGKNYKGKGKRNYKRKYGRQDLTKLNRSPMPVKFLTKFRHVQTFELDPGAAADSYDLHVFKANSPYLPSFTSPTEVARGYSKLMTHYEHCTVIGSKIKVTFSADPAGDIPAIFGLTVKSTSAALTTADDYLENGGTVTKINTVSGTGLKQVLVNKFSTKQYSSMANLMDNQNLKATATGNPGEQYFWHVWMSKLNVQDAVENPAPVLAIAEIEYICVLTEPKAIDGE